MRGLFPMTGEVAPPPGGLDRRSRLRYLARMERVAKRSTEHPAREARAHSGSDTDQVHARHRVRAAVISLVAGLLILAAKFYAYMRTDSTAVFSDALESIVNVVAASFAIWAVVFASKPADRNHPYGHGKIEFVSAGFEGGLISFAALLLIYHSIMALFHGPQLRELDFGLAVVVVAGLCNAVLGAYLIRVGRRTRSETLIADGRHVLSDFWTSAGVAVGLVLVLMTGLQWLDPVVGILVAARLLVTGAQLVRSSFAGLLDEEDPEVVERLVAALDAEIATGIIRVHSVRAIRLGRFHHIDAHVVVPEFWTAIQAHDAADDFEDRVMRRFGEEGEIEIHTDPCWKHYCAACDVEPCPVRRAPFAERPPLTVEEAVHPDPPVTPLDPEAIR